MYILLFLVISTVILILLAQISGIFALLFFILAIIFLPASIIHRRDIVYETEIGPESERQSLGALRLLRMIGLDTTGVALAVLLIILVVLVAKTLASH
jgi:hypothetical protein